jgi:RNA polymerase sigma-70 factor (ECF subfamily)
VDVAAFEALFRDHQSEVYRWIMRIVRDPSVAEDLTVETFWRVWKSADRFDPQRGFEPWARRIATNLAITHLRHRPREIAYVTEPVAPAAADAAVASDTSLKIQRAFRELPPKLQAAATLALIEEQKYEDIASALGISVGGVKSRVFRAVRILRRKLEKAGITP